MKRECLHDENPPKSKLNAFLRKYEEWTQRKLETLISLLPSSDKQKTIAAMNEIRQAACTEMKMKVQKHIPIMTAYSGTNSFQTKCQEARNDLIKTARKAHYDMHDEVYNTYPQAHDHLPYIHVVAPPFNHWSPASTVKDFKDKVTSEIQRFCGGKDGETKVYDHLKANFPIEMLVNGLLAMPRRVLDPFILDLKLARSSIEKHMPSSFEKYINDYTKKITDTAANLIQMKQIKCNLATQRLTEFFDRFFPMVELVFNIQDFKTLFDDLSLPLYTIPK